MTERRGRLFGTMSVTEVGGGRKQGMMTSQRICGPNSRPPPLALGPTPGSAKGVSIRLGRRANLTTSPHTKGVPVRHHLAGFQTNTYTLQHGLSCVKMSLIWIDSPTPPPLRHRTPPPATCASSFGAEADPGHVPQPGYNCHRIEPSPPPLDETAEPLGLWSFTAAVL